MQDFRADDELYRCLVDGLGPVLTERFARRLPNVRAKE
jgi:hypothetical protein